MFWTAALWAHMLDAVCTYSAAKSCCTRYLCNSLMEAWWAENGT